MDIKFAVVSKDTKFSMLDSKFTTSDATVSIETAFLQNNKDSLPKVYNKLLEEERNGKAHDYLVLMHSDVEFDVGEFISHLKSIDGKYDILGLCGTATLNVSQSPLNWWNGSRLTPNLRWGCVCHGELGNQTSYFSSHSPGVLDAEVSCIDGLCIIFSKKAILETPIKFDENLGDFDFYDTDISCQAMMTYHLKLGVMVQMDLKHHSVGKSILTPEFLGTEVKFRQKWGFPIPSDSPVAKFIADSLRVNQPTPQVQV